MRFRAPDTTVEGTPLTGSVSWAVTSGSGATIDSTGLFSASQSGAYIVQATRSGHKGRSRVQVSGAGATMMAVRVSPPSITLQPGAAFTFGVTGVLSDSSTVPVTANWSATGGTIGSNGIYRAGTAAGSFRVIAIQQGGALADTATVTISPSAPTLEALLVSPAAVSLGTGSAQQFSAVGRMSDGSTSVVSVSWSATGGTINSSGHYTAGSTAGSFRVTAVQQGGTKADTSTVTITSAPPVPTLQAVEVTPSSVTLTTGDTQQFSAVGRMSDGGTSSVVVNWSATGGNITSSGSYTASSTAGSFRVIAVQQGGTRADTSTITVTAPAPTLQAIVVSPGSVNLAPGTSQQFSASGRMSDGSTSGVTVTWSATGGSISSSGAYTAGGTDGTFRVIAVQEGSTRADTASVTIATPPPTVTLTAVEVSPSTASMLAGSTQQFSAIGRMSDGSTSNVSVSWSETGGSITGAGLYTAGSTAGTFRVIALEQGGTHADTAIITLTEPAPVLQSIILSPPSVTLDPGEAQQFSAVGRMSDGSTSSVNVNWSETGGAVTSSGLYTAGAAAGTFRVIAVQQGGNMADTATVTINQPAPVLTGVEVTPASVTVAAGGTQQFSAIGRLSDNTTTSVSVTWSATGGTVTSGGSYTAGSSAGTYRVIAVRQGDTKADTAVVTVTPPAPTLTGIEVTPASVTVAAGGTQQFSVIGRMSDNTTTSVSVTWSATGGTVTSGGLYTAGSSAGTYRLIAVRQGDTKADTSTVMVTPPPPTLTAIEVTPATATVAVGTSQQFSVVGRMSDNTTTSVSVTWSATGGTVTSGGVYTAGSSAGTYQVIATQQGGTRADTGTVTVTSGGTGGALGTPDPTLLRALPVSGSVTTIDPGYAAFQALDPRSKPSGWTYPDPVTGVTVVKVTASGSPTTGNTYNWYGDGGTLISHAWASGSDWYVTMMVFGGSRAWLVDLKITGTPTLANWRELTGTLKPQSDLTFTFSSVPGTARTAYVVSGGVLHRINTQTMTVADGGTFPRSGFGGGPVWLQGDKDDRWFVASTGTTARAFNAQSGAWISTTWSGLNEVRIDRDGGYAVLSSTGQSKQLWNLGTNTVTAAPTGVPFAHNASLRQRWVGTNWDLAAPWGVWKVTRSGESLGNTPALYRNGFYGGSAIHWAGNWIQNVSDLDQQWAVGAGLAGVSGMWAKRAVGLVKANGTDARLLGHHYNNWGSGDYWALPFVQISAGGHVVSVNTRLAYSDTNENSRTDILAYIMPRSGGQ